MCECVYSGREPAGTVKCYESNVDNMSRKQTKINSEKRRNFASQKRGRGGLSAYLLLSTVIPSYVIP